MIEFSDTEQKLFKLIKEYAISLNAKVVPRLAGGFVRDRILGIKSSDIDIAIENISGLAFAIGLSESLKDHPTVHKISANPDKSKHLETAVLTIFGFSIDFVHLRTETYSDSRIPIIIAGTPKQDAERRDITINSIFYNLITDEIEDFTGRGLEDLKNKVIDTPIDPKITLFDDPLRIIRIFRFKSKFGFEISERVYDAIKDQKVKEALKNKVSKERNLIEIEKMLCYKNGEVGLIEMIANGYVEAVFKPKINVKIDLERSKIFLDLKFKVLNMFKSDMFAIKEIDYSILKLYVVLQYFIGLKIKEKKKIEFVNVQIIRESLKASRMMISSVEFIEMSIEFYNSLDSDISDTKEIDPIEFVVNSGNFWFESLVILYSTTKNVKYLNLISKIFKNGWQESYLVKPTVDGDYLVSLGTKPLHFRRILKESLIIQIKSPELSRDEILSKVQME